MSARFDRLVGRHPSATLLTLMLLAGYFLVSYRVALANLGVAEPPAGAPAAQSLTWLGRWRMFTELRPRHTDLEADACDDAGHCTRVDLAALYPNHWDEGPGYLRDDFLRDPRRTGLLATDLCARTGATAIRLVEVSWARTPGTSEQPRRDETRLPRGETTCR